jgi:hypothetical protein
MSNQTRGAATGVATGAASGFMVGGPIGAVVGGVLGGISGALSGGAADDAEDLADMQAKFTRMETAENVRRMKETAEAQVGEAEAIVGASNLVMSGSSKNYINELRSQWSEDINWKRRSGWMTARMQREGGQVASEGIMNNLYAQQIATVGTAAVSAYGGGSEMTQLEKSNTSRPLVGTTSFP